MLCQNFKHLYDIQKMFADRCVTKAMTHVCQHLLILSSPAGLFNMKLAKSLTPCLRL